MSPSIKVRTSQKHEEGDVFPEFPRTEPNNPTDSCFLAAARLEEGKRGKEEGMENECGSFFWDASLKMVLIGGEEGAQKRFCFKWKTLEPLEDLMGSIQGEELILYNGKIPGFI